jgi:hypothetical protein
LRVVGFLINVPILIFGTYSISCRLIDRRTALGNAALNSIDKSLNEATGSPASGATSVWDAVQPIIYAVIFVGGIVAAMAIIMGGVQYSTSQGDGGKTKKAKDTIMYGIIGLVVAILAFAIVNFVLIAIQQ